MSALRVDPPFARQHIIGLTDRVVDPSRIQDQLDAGPQHAMQKRGDARAKASRCSCAGKPRNIHAKILLYAKRKVLKPCVQSLPHLARNALLRAKHIRCAILARQRIIHVAGRNDRNRPRLFRLYDPHNIRQILRDRTQRFSCCIQKLITERSSHADAAVICCAAAKAEQDLCHAV